MPYLPVFAVIPFCRPPVPMGAVSLPACLPKKDPARPGHRQVPRLTIVVSLYHVPRATARPSPPFFPVFPARPPEKRGQGNRSGGTEGANRPGRGMPRGRNRLTRKPAGWERGKREEAAARLPRTVACGGSVSCPPPGGRRLLPAAAAAALPPRRAAPSAEGQRAQPAETQQRQREPQRRVAPVARFGYRFRVVAVARSVNTGLLVVPNAFVASQ